MKTLILDIDHCLVFASYSELPFLDLKSKRGYHYLYFRPYLNEFLKYIEKSSFKIVFYTSGKSEYAKWIVKQFNLKKDYMFFTRSSTKRKITDYGDVFLKSSQRVGLRATKKTFVIDDRIDLWEDNGEIFLDISPWHGEKDDNELQRIMIQLLKNQPKLSSLKINNSNKS